MGSLKADSAMTVWATLALTRDAVNSGMRMAGSVGASTAPSSSDSVQENPKARWAGTATMEAVRITPGIDSSPSDSAVWRSTRSERFSPP